MRSRSVRILLPCAVILSLSIVIPVSVNNVKAKQGSFEKLDFDAPPDYIMDDVSKFVYYDEKGFNDRNNDGQVTIVIKGILDFGTATRDGITYENPLPLILKGTQDGEIKNVDAHALTFLPSKSPAGIRGVKFTKIGKNAVRAKRDLMIRDSRLMSAGHIISTGSIIIENSQFEKITADSGGAIWAGSKILVKNSQFQGIQSKSEPGGTIFAKGDVTVKNTIFNKTKAPRDDGGAIYSEKTVKIINSQFFNSQAGSGWVGGSGGAIYAEGDVKIQSSEFENVEIKAGSSIYAEEHQMGGAIFAGGDLIVLKSVFNNVNAWETGVLGGKVLDGGLYAMGDITLRNSRFKDLRAHTKGWVEVSAIQTKSNFILENVTIIKANEIQGSKGIIDSSRFTEVHSTCSNGYERTIITNHLQIQNSHFKKIGDLRARSLEIKNSSFISSGKFRGRTIYLKKILICRPTKTEILSTNYTLQEVDVIEATRPVFEGELPEKGIKVFIDLNKDDEEWGEWDADVFWSAESPFLNYEKIGLDIKIIGLKLSRNKVYVGKSVKDTIKVTNSGWRKGTKELELLMNGKVIKKKSVTLSPNESRSVEFTFSPEKEGTYTIRIGKFTQELTVEKRPAKFEISNLRLSKIKVKPGEKVAVSATVTNAGGMKGDHDVEFYVAGELVETKTITLSSGESKVVQFNVAKTEEGIYRVKIGNLTGSFEVTEFMELPKPKKPGRGIPLVQIISGTVAAIAIGVGIMAYVKRR